MIALRELERYEWRVLGALRLADATTGATIGRALQVEAPDASLVRNRSGLYVIRHWAGLATHESEFLAPPADPAPGSQSLTLSVTDPEGGYLPVTAVLRLPRSPDPAHADDADSLFQPAVVSLFPSSGAPVGANWAVLRVSVSDTASGDALGGALLRVRSNGDVLGRGLSDWRGEALVPVVGVPVTTFSDDPHAVVISEINVTLEAAFDPATGGRVAADAVRAGLQPAEPPRVDPAAIENAFGALPHAQVALRIAARRSQSVALTIGLP